MPMSRDELNRRRRARADTRLEQQRREREQPSIDWDGAIARLRVMLDGRS